MIKDVLGYVVIQSYQCGKAECPLHGNVKCVGCIGKHLVSLAFKDQCTGNKSKTYDLAFGTPDNGALTVDVADK